jgi:flagellar biosynthesis activator protein FlaF
MKAAVRLKTVQDQWDSDRFDLDGALAYNRKLWTILATSATETDSPLPEELQRNISLIAIFIFNRSLDLIVEPKREDLDVLIEINRNIAAGLQVMPKAAA